MGQAGHDWGLDPVPGHSTQGQARSGCSLPPVFPQHLGSSPGSHGCAAPGVTPPSLSLRRAAPPSQGQGHGQHGGPQRRAEAGAGLPQAWGQLSCRVQNPEPLWPPCLPLCGFCPFPPLVGLPVHTPCTRGVWRPLGVGVPVAGLGVASGMEVSTDKGQALEVTTRSRTVVLGGGPGAVCGVISRRRGWQTAAVRGHGRWPGRACDTVTVGPVAGEPGSIPTGSGPNSHPCGCCLVWPQRLCTRTEGPEWVGGRGLSWTLGAQGDRRVPMRRGVMGSSVAPLGTGRTGMGSPRSPVTL